MTSKILGSVVTSIFYCISGMAAVARGMKYSVSKSRFALSFYNHLSVEY